MKNFILKHNIAISVSLAIAAVVAIIIIGLVGFAQKSSAVTILTVPQGGTGWVSIQSNAVLFGNGTGRLSTTTAGTAGQVLMLSGGVPTWSSTSTGITSLNGLTGATQTFADNDYVDITSAGTVHTFTGTTSPTFGTIFATSSIGSTGNRVPNIYATNLDTTILVNDFVSGDLEVLGDIYAYRGDIFLGTGLATTTLTVNAANVLQITGGGFVAQASSTVVGAFQANSLVLLTALADAYVADDITLTNITQITNRAITDTTGTLTIARGGTNATSFTTSGNAVYYNGTSLLTAPLATAITIPFASSTAASLTNFTIGASGQLVIPNAADPTITVTGQVGLNTTTASTSLRFYDGTAERVLNVRKSFSILWSHTGQAGTSTQTIANLEHPITIASMFCKTALTATSSFNFTDGTNATDSMQCTRLGTTDDGSISNAAFTMREDIQLAIGSMIGTPGTTTISVSYYEDAD